MRPLTLWCLGSVAISLAIGQWLGGSELVGQHLGSFVFAGASVALALWILCYIVGGMVRGLSRMRKLATDQTGAAAAEFVITVMPFFFLLFGVMQMALVSMAKVSVGYAAFCAARAAVRLQVRPVSGDEVAADTGLFVQHLDQRVADGRTDRKRFFDVPVLGRRVETPGCERSHRGEQRNQREQRAVGEARLAAHVANPLGSDRGLRNVRRRRVGRDSR